MFHWQLGERAYIASAISHLLVDIVVANDLVHFAQDTRYVFVDKDHLRKVSLFIQRRFVPA